MFMDNRARAAMLIAAALSLTVAGTAAAKPGGDQPGRGHGLDKPAFELTLLHNNDAESKLLTGDSTPNYGGAARFSTVLERVRADAARRERGDAPRRGTVLVSSGDNFLAGLNLSASFAKGVPWYDAIAFNFFGYDAATIGNHEFDFGPDRLAEFIRGTDRSVPFLSANRDVSAEPALAELERDGRIAASTIVRRQGERIGIIGLTTPDLPILSSPRNVVVSAALAEAVNREQRRVERRGADIVILSSHLQGLPSELALIPQLSGVDIVIAGGGDELLANPGDPLAANAGTPFSTYPYRDPATGAKPTDADGREVQVVTTAGELRYVGRLTAVFDKRGRVLEIDEEESLPVRVSGLPTDPDYAEKDPWIVQYVEQPLLVYRAALDANVIAQSGVALDGRNPDPIRRRESNLGNLVADAFLATGNAQVAITNGGGIRNNSIIPAGPISEGDTFDILPFDNLIVTVPDVPRDVFKGLLENGYSVLNAAGTGSGGRFAHIAGLRVVVDPTRPVGSRVVSAVLDDGTVIVAGGAVVAGPPLDVATTDFLARGGDGYQFGRPFVSTTVAYQRALYDYLTGPLAGQVTAAAYPAGGEDRIVITTDP